MNLKEDKPEEVGMSSERLKRIDCVLRDYVDSGKIPGFVCLIARHGEIAYSSQIGFSDIEADKLMQPDTIFRIASMTKPITSVAAMMLYEQGLFALDDPVSEYISEFADLKVYAGEDKSEIITEEMKSKVTVQDLMTSTAGVIPYEFGIGAPDSAVVKIFREKQSASVGGNISDSIQRLLCIPLIHQPDTTWRYSPSLDLIARIVEVVSNQDFRSFLIERIFKPLKMIDTDFGVGQDVLDRLVVPYNYTDCGLKRGEQPNDPTVVTVSGHTGLFSTASDYLKFSQMLLNGGELNGVRLLTRRTVEYMTMNHVSSNLLPLWGIEKYHEKPVWVSDFYRHLTKGYGYGLGMRVLLDPAESGTIGNRGEFGWMGSPNTYFWVDPKEKLIGILMSQYSPIMHFPVDRQFKALMYQTLLD